MTYSKIYHKAVAKINKKCIYGEISREERRIEMLKVLDYVLGTKEADLMVDDISSDIDYFMDHDYDTLEEWLDAAHSCEDEIRIFAKHGYDVTKMEKMVRDSAVRNAPHWLGIDVA